MNAIEAIKALKATNQLVWPEVFDEPAVLGQALNILLSLGYHSFEYESLDSGGLLLRTGDIEVTDPHERPARGDMYRHITLMVLAAVEAANREDREDGGST